MKNMMNINIFDKNQMYEKKHIVFDSSIIYEYIELYAILD